MTAWHYDPHSATKEWERSTWSSIAQKARASFLHLHVSAELFTTQNMGHGEEMNVRARRIHWEIRLEVTNRTQTGEGKMVVVLYLCLHLYLSFRVCSVRSGEWALEKSHCTLAFKARWCDHRWFFRRTAKNLVAYATSWSLTLSPAKVKLC